MCGIAGCYNYSGSIEKERFEEMVDLVTHRGPDDRGTWYDERIALGHRRLSIIDLSRDGRQPFVYRDRYVLTYNGEIYNYREIRADLEQKGYQFATNTDTEVLVAAYDHYGKECVHLFNGMWAFALYDIKKGELYCSRDRFGVKPFYYWATDGRLLFGSEIKQIVFMRKEKPTANHKKLMQFIICGDQDDSNETMFADIMQLQAGHELILSVNTGKYSIRRYYDLKKKPRFSGNYEAACKEFAEKFKQSVRLRLRADVPIGYCLSGGLDSSAIVSAASRQVKAENMNIDQHAVSSCFRDKAYDEQEYIDEVVHECDVRCHKIYPDGNSLFQEVDKIIWHMDEPFGSTSIYAQWNVFKEAASQGLTVMLDGQGADEQLAGYTDFYRVCFGEHFKKLKWVTLYREVQSYLKLRAVTEAHISAVRTVLGAVYSVCKSYMPEIIRKRIEKRYHRSYSLPFTEDQIREAYNNRKQYPIGDAKQYILDSMEGGMQSLLHFEDRDSMAFSVESRVPFLDYQLVEAIFSMPFGYKIRNGITKAVLRDGLKGILPEKIRTRYSKLGFVTPEDQWINENYDIYKRELELACDALEPLLCKKKILSWFEASQGKIARGEFLVWRIICAGRWVRVFDVEITGESCD